MPNYDDYFGTYIEANYGESSVGPSVKEETLPVINSTGIPLTGSFALRVYDIGGIDLSTLELVFNDISYGSASTELTLHSIDGIVEYLIYFQPPVMENSTMYTIQLCVSNRQGVPGMFSVGDTV